MYKLFLLFLIFFFVFGFSALSFSIPCLLALALYMGCNPTNHSDASSFQGSNVKGEIKVDAARKSEREEDMSTSA